MKTGNEFEEIVNVLVRIQKREKKFSNKNLILKTINSTRSDQGSLFFPGGKVNAEFKAMKETLKSVSEAVYICYSALPFASEETTLFEAETKEELISQLADIGNFAERYNQLKKDLDSRVARTENAYMGLVRSLVKIYGAEEKVLLSSIQELKISPNDEKELIQNVPSMVHSDRERYRKGSRS